MTSRLTFFILLLIVPITGLCQIVMQLYGTQVPNSIPTKDTEYWTSYNFLQNVTQPTFDRVLAGKNPLQHSGDRDSWRRIWCLEHPL
jgi:hypothetical protein